MEKGEGNDWKMDQMDSKEVDNIGNDEPAEAKGDSRPKGSRPRRERRVEIAEDDNIASRQDDEPIQNTETSGGNE